MSFKFPPLPKIYLNTDIIVTGEIAGEDGLTTSELYNGKCIFDEKERKRNTADKGLIILNALVIIPGDINPDKDINGYCMVHNVKRLIAGSRRPRNPDGTVYSTELDLF